MLEGKECEGGHWLKIEGELLATFTTIESEYGLGRLELGFAAAKALLAHVHKTQEPEQVIEFVEKLSEVLEEQARLLRECLLDDQKARMH